MEYCELIKNYTSGGKFCMEVSKEGIIEEKCSDCFYGRNDICGEEFRCTYINKVIKENIIHSDTCENFICFIKAFSFIHDNRDKLK